MDAVDHLFECPDRFVNARMKGEDLSESKVRPFGDWNKAVHQYVKSNTRVGCTSTEAMVIIARALKKVSTCSQTKIRQ